MESVLLQGKGCSSMLCVACMSYFASFDIQFRVNRFRRHHMKSSGIETMDGDLESPTTP
jgi:hypothetical protein